MKLLIVGGAGYIGSHMVRYLSSVGCSIVVLDDISTGHRHSVQYGQFIEGNISDGLFLDSLFKKFSFDAVMHFASSIQVGESVQHPEKYYINNVANTLVLLKSMMSAGIYKIIFSSSAATFGNPIYSPIDERHPQVPINPYGRTKLMVEQILGDYDRAYGLKSVILRYFNAAGADPGGGIGEEHEPETHLIPLILRVALGLNQSISIFGDDYKTHDGTCIRDYVHVRDLCQAHWLGLCSLMNGESSQAYNLGNGDGFSVLDVVDAARSITNKEINIKFSSRRAGDPDILVADSTLARKNLGWKPEFPEIKKIIEHAWAWELSKRSF